METGDVEGAFILSSPGLESVVLTLPIVVYIAKSITMALSVRHILFMFITIAMFKKGVSQLGLDLTFLQQIVLDYMFPKDMGIVKVKSMDQKRELGGTVILDFVGMVEQYKLGYTAEEHKITTEDGYILQIHRISGSPLSDNKKKKEIVFLQHCLLGSSDIWVLLGPGKDLAFLLADQGYDVWFGNVRGNSYGRSHVNMTVYDNKFWDFSFHEMGLMDLPPTFDYIFNHTGKKDMHYVGHSMGSTMMFILLSMKPEYNAKIKLFTALAPAVYIKESNSVFSQIVFAVTLFSEYLARHNIYEVAAQTSALITVAREFCHDGAITQPICIAIMFVLVGADPPQLNTTTLPYVLSHVPAGTSTKTIYHFNQIIVTDNFQSINYGPVGNYARYKQNKPITYDLSKVAAPVALYHSPNDMIISKTSVMEIKKHLPNVVFTEEVQYRLFHHLDFLWAIDAKTLLYDRVIELMQKFDVKPN